MNHFHKGSVHCLLQVCLECNTHEEVIPRGLRGESQGGAYPGPAFIHLLDSGMGVFHRSSG